MAAKPVQVSIDEELLRQIDADRETRERGRSAFLRSAARLYLRAKERQQVDEAFRRAYDGKADELFEEIKDMLEGQVWPPE